jgi:HEAT repeat protein
LLTAYLVGFDAPLAVRQVVARRTDSAFVSALLSMPIDSSNAALAKNMERIKSLACLESAEGACRRLPPAAQAAAMRLVALSGASDAAKLEFAAVLLRHGGAEGRVAACESLQRISGQRSNELVLAALDDDNGAVQAAATRQLRDRHIPGTMARLIELVASPHAEVQAAARESLAEFSFENFLARYELMDEDARRSTGVVVALVDMTALDGLRQEFSSLVRRRRLRAIEVAAAMGVTAKVADVLIELMDDEDHMVRAAAASALGDCSPMDVRDALLDALGDRSHAVQTAARDSLRALGFEADARGAASQREQYR